MFHDIHFLVCDDCPHELWSSSPKLFNYTHTSRHLESEITLILSTRYCIWINIFSHPSLIIYKGKQKKFLNESRVDRAQHIFLLLPQHGLLLLLSSFGSMFFSHPSWVIYESKQKFLHESTVNRGQCIILLLPIVVWFLTIGMTCWCHHFDQCLCHNQHLSVCMRGWNKIIYYLAWPLVEIGWPRSIVTSPFDT